MDSRGLDAAWLHLLSLPLDISSICVSMTTNDQIIRLEMSMTNLNKVKSVSSAVAGPARYGSTVSEGFRLCIQLPLRA